MEQIMLSCPNCGASVSLNHKNCAYCDSPILISTMSSLNKLSYRNVENYIQEFSKYDVGEHDQIDISKGICLLKINQYHRAIESFSQIVNQRLGYSEAYFYTAVALLEGKSAFKVKRSIINQILSLLETACSLEDKGIYHYFLSYIKYDYFKRKYIHISPSFEEELNKAKEIGCSELDKQSLIELLGVSFPKKIRI